MEPLHTLEYEMTSELATEVQRTLLRFGTRHDWRRDLPLLAGWLVFAGLLAWPVLAGWWSPGVGGTILFLVTLYVLVVVYRWRWLHYAAATAAVAGMHTSDRRVRLEFHAQRVLMETEFFRGEGAWTELEQVTMFPEFWALRFSNGGQIVIPATLVTPELRAFLHAKAEQQQAAIVQG